MKFVNLFNSADSSPDNTITDGKFTVSYKELPELFERINACMIEKHINREDYLAVECENEVIAAVFFLFLFEYDYSFAALTKTANSPIVPDFFRYRIDIKSEENGLDDGLWKPSGWLRSIPNENWNGQVNSSGGGKLFLKTSGSTGNSKLAAISHSSVQGSACIGLKRLMLASSDRIALPAPIFHSFGLIAAFLSGVSVGASFDIQKGANLLRFLQREREFQPNVAFMTPIFCELLIKGRRSSRPYRLTVSAGDRFRADMFSRYEAMSGCLVNLYGCTELGAMAAGSPDDPAELRGYYVGKPLENVQFRLEEHGDAEDEEQEGLGVLWCKHPYGFDGYVDEQGELIPPDHNFKDGWFCVKDLGIINPDGYVRVLGRSDHSVNRDGRLVFFSDVEKMVATIPGVASVAVLSTGESDRGRNLIAVCVPSDGCAVTAEILKSACFEVMPRNNVPDRFILMESLPLLPTGKLDRQRLHRLVTH